MALPGMRDVLCRHFDVNGGLFARAATASEKEALAVLLLAARDFFPGKANEAPAGGAVRVQAAVRLVRRVPVSHASFRRGREVAFFEELLRQRQEL